VPATAGIIKLDKRNPVSIFIPKLLVIRFGVYPLFTQRRLSQRQAMVLKRFAKKHGLVRQPGIFLRLFHPTNHHLHHFHFRI
jgi:hypothetical protein